MSDLLSHYTSRAGLEGIACSKTLWATNFLEVNDKTELLYGIVELMVRATEKAYEVISAHADPQHPVGAFNKGEIEEKMRAMYKHQFATSPLIEGLHVLSFAQHRNQSHEDRGHRSLWSEYTGNKGYCLQFLRSDIERLLTLERLRRSYLILQLAEVKYGVDKFDELYATFLFQTQQYMLAEAARVKPGLGLRPELMNLAPFNVYSAEFLSYCAKHKDPFFEDERELRILAFPAPVDQISFGVGIATRKQSKIAPDGRHYIELFQGFSPGIEPARIIIGPEASPDINDILQLFTRRPIVVKAEYPLRTRSP